MPYESLYTLYYKNPSAWENEYTRRQTGAGIRRLDFEIQEYGRPQKYPAFFCYAEDIALLQEQIMRAFTALLGLLRHIPGAGIDQFLHTCLVQEIKSTNDIEGVHSTQREIRTALETSAKERLRLRLGSVVNKYVRITQGEHIALSTAADIRALFDDFIADEIRRDDPKKVPDGTLFRTASVDIVTAAQKTVHRGSYPEERIIRDMTYALDVLHMETIPMLVRIAIFHYLFGYIHPFYDGNGRMARLITAYLLADALHPTVALQLSVFIKKRRKQYYKLFSITNSAFNKGDLTPFIIGTLQFISEAVQCTGRVLEERLAAYRRYREKLSSRKITDKTMRGVYDILLQAAVFSDVGATVEEMTRTLGKTDTTVYKKLGSMPAAHLKKDKTSRPYHYALRLSVFD